jgi:hypothetical protein
MTGISFDPDEIVTGPICAPLMLIAVLRSTPRSSAGNDQSRSSRRLIRASVRPPR